MNRFFFSIIFFSILFNSCRVVKDKNDYALQSNMNEWSHDYAFGSPTWDAFGRFAGNPVYRGRKGMEWPVNGFLYSDPVSHNWYLYIGEYKEFYKSDKDTTTADFNCVIYKSSDRGKTWNKIGDLFPANMLSYDSIKIQVPDVMVTYADGKYHMVFDWVPGNFDWQNAGQSGLGYAVADKPEGPFVVSKKPVKINTQYKQKPLLNRYWRMYAPMIVKRKNDWVLIYMMDSAPARSWALAVSTASKPEGPYGDTKIMLNVERKTNYPPLQEYFPAFTHDGYVYFPATSVSVNRNYQSVYRVKIEDITNADKYEIFSAGTLWHSANVENEYAGIWGQTFTGFVDDNDSIYVMFPSKDKTDYGTINLAKASWDHPYRDRGFNLTANEGNSFSYIKKATEVKDIDVKFKLDGTMHIIWDFHTPLDILNGWGKFELDQDDANYKEIVVNKNNWKMNVYDSGKSIVHVDSGNVPNWNPNENTLQIKKIDGKYRLFINDVKCWEGALKSNPGVVGVLLNPHSYLFADRFVVEGPEVKGLVTYGYYRALVAAGDQDSDWVFKKDTMFLYGKGAVSKRDSGFAKWNFDGKGFELFSPRGPMYGTINIYLDGKLIKNLSLKSSREIKSSVLFKSGDLTSGSHAVYIESLDGPLPVDCIKIEL
ncbi:MAG: hypothetical protein Q8891_15265 [Bacteroidota bacterium]|nr:hypothetical protein [Bacteroidota bacterium]